MFLNCHANPHALFTKQLGPWPLRPASSSSSSLSRLTRPFPFPRRLLCICRPPRPSIPSIISSHQATSRRQRRPEKPAFPGRLGETSQQMFQHLKACSLARSLIPSLFYPVAFLPPFEGRRRGGSGGGCEERIGTTMVGRQFFLNIRGPTAGCFCLPACINLCGPLAAAPAQGASQHLGLKSRGGGTGGRLGWRRERDMSVRGQKILGKGCF